MKAGDLVKVKDSWVGYRYVDEKEIIAVIRFFEQDLELDENLEYMWKAHLTATNGLFFWVFAHHLEVLSEGR